MLNEKNNKNFIIPSEIPWTEIKGVVLEELCYWLLKSMGAQELYWRHGGKINGAADQGRDLECVFYDVNENPPVKNKWWIEAKGRKGKITTSLIKEVASNTLNRDDVNILLFVSNNHFSNHAKDWVEQWNNHRKTKIIFWSKIELELFSSQYPEAFMRIYSNAISVAGKLEICRIRFWQYISFTEKKTLELLWKNRQSLNFTDESLIALLVSELANGDINTRAWGWYIEESVLENSLLLILMNYLGLVIRGEERGIEQGIIHESVSYIVLCCILKFGSKKTKEIFERAISNDLPEKILQDLHSVLFSNIFFELREICTPDCRRIFTESMKSSRENIKEYRNRFTSIEKDKKPNRILTLIHHEEPCKVGFNVTSKNYCPIETHEEIHSLAEILSVIEKIIRFRISSFD